ncbi:hypothetical protein [Phaeovulum sp. W22_SRMD_FR3]|uniref:hypothetical protein n=1 Tax=Phaeovulum sp. W22_SRMD_FR3 TaxID=3240274 RepID=UPI003F99FE5C
MTGRLLEGAELCMGSRFKGEVKPGAMPWKNRYVGNPALSGILRLPGLIAVDCGADPVPGRARGGIRAFPDDVGDRQSRHSECRGHRDVYVVCGAGFAGGHHLWRFGGGALILARRGPLSDHRAVGRVAARRAVIVLALGSALASWMIARWVFQGSGVSPDE